jgi:hypothetical protein
MSIQRPIAIAALLAVLLLAPGLAGACPVCFSGQDANRLAFTITAVFMTFLPLIMVGSAVYWLWRLAQARELREQSAQRTAQRI